jgi:serine O-acetyltransferase
MVTLSDLLKTISMDLQSSTGRRGITPTLSALTFEPGFACVFFYRISVFVYLKGFRRLGMFLWRRNSVRYGCYLHLHARIAGGLKLPHPIGVVIGEGVEIAEWVTLYQGVTIGKDTKPNSYPSIGSKAILFTNTVVFGAIRIGSGAVVGAGSILNQHNPSHGRHLKIAKR